MFEKSRQLDARLQGRVWHIVTWKGEKGKPEKVKRVKAEAQRAKIAVENLQRWEQRRSTPSGDWILDRKLLQLASYIIHNSRESRATKGQ